MQVVFPVAPRGRHAPVFTLAQIKARKLFQCRIAKRLLQHGNWRQTWIDCGGQCVKCGSTEYLEFHEPLGEDGIMNGWGRLQARMLLCFPCHCEEHPENTENMDGGWQRKSGNTLNYDVQIEIWMCGGWEKWIERFGLQDTFGRLYCQ